VKRRQSAALLAGLLAWPAARAAAAPARTLRLATGESLQALVDRAHDGDVVEIGPGDHAGLTAVVHQRRLTLRGVGARPPVLHAAGRHAEGKAILVLRDGDFTIEHLAFRGARVPDGNGAGIRFERGRLRLRGCHFHDNEMGLLTGNHAGSELRVEACAFGDAPRHGTVNHHLLYVGRIARFELLGSCFGNGWRGHLVKSRALVNEVRYNRLVDGDRGEGGASYELEFPDGGLATVVGNLIVQGPQTQNDALVAFGAEAAPDDERAHALVMVHNTLVNRAAQAARFLQLHAQRLRHLAPPLLLANVLAGAGAGGDPFGAANVHLPQSPWSDAADEDFKPPRQAAWRWRAPALPDPALRPRAQFELPLGTRPLPEGVRLWPGAVQR
jgi:hypothetical protein